MVCFSRVCLGDQEHELGLVRFVFIVPSSLSAA